MLTKSQKIVGVLLAIGSGLIAISGRKLICSLRGHDYMMEFEPGRVYLYCRHCDTSTDGWQIGKFKDKFIEKVN